jgi:glycosyltransferase 2 family protein
VALEAPEPRTSGRWKLVLKLFVSVGLLAYLARRVDLAQMARFLEAANPWLLVVAWSLYLFGQFLSAVKWRRLATAVGFRAPLSRFVAYYFIGMFFNAFGFGTVGGDMIRALYLAGGAGRRALALNTVVADRVSGLLVLLAIALVSLLVLHQYELPAAIYWGVIAFSAALLGGWRMLPHVLPRLLPAQNRLRRLIERDLAPYWNDGRLLAEIGALSAIFHLSQITVLLILTRALGIEVPPSYCFIVGPLVNVMAAIPVSLNGLGVREGGYVYFLSHVGVPRASAVAFALSWFAVVMLAGAVGGTVYLVYRQSPRDESQSDREVKSAKLR